MVTTAPTSRYKAWHLKMDLWWQFTVRAVEMRHRGSYLGFFWAVLNPLLTAALYVTVFAYVFNGRYNVSADESRIDYALGVFLSLILFHTVSETLAASPTIIVAQPNLVKKVVFPLEVLPPAQLGAIWFHASVSLLLFLACALAFGRGLSVSAALWLPVIVAPLALLTLGLVWLLAAVGVFLRDVTQVVPLLSQVLLWSSAIFFSPVVFQHSPLAWACLKWNPLLHTVDLSRGVLLWGQSPDGARLAYTWAAGAAVSLAGWLIFRRIKPLFAEAL